MKENKLLDVSLEKTEKQKVALKEFLKRNGQFELSRPTVETGSVLLKEDEANKTQYQIQNIQENNGHNESEEEETERLQE